jgi:hypothetical protein
VFFDDGTKSSSFGASSSSVTVVDKEVTNSKGFFSMPNFSGAGLVACGANSLGAATLDERLCFSSLVMSECGAPIYP